MKKILKASGVIAMFAVIAVAAATLSLDAMVKKAVNDYAPGIVKTDVTLDRADIGLLKAEAVFGGLTVGRPKGFKEPEMLKLGSVRIEIDRGSLLKETIRVKKVEVRGIALTYEVLGARTNVGALLDGVKSGSADEETAAKPDAGDRHTRRVVIDELTVTGASLRLAAGTALAGSVGAAVTLPDFVMRDIGRGRHMTWAEACAEVLTKFMDGVSTAVIQLSAKGLNDAAEAANGWADKVKGLFN